MNTFNRCLLSGLAVVALQPVWLLGDQPVRKPDNIAATNEAQSDRDHAAADWLPADTVAMAQIPNVAEFRRKFAASSFGAQANDPAFSRFFQSVLQSISQANDGLTLDLQQIWQQVDGELALGVAPDAEGRLSVIAVADFESSAAATQMIQRLEEQLKSEGASLTSVQLQSQTVQSWRRDSGRELESLSYVRDGDTVLFGDRLQTLAEIYTSAARNSLSDDTTYRHVSQRVAGTGEQSGATWFVNPSAAVAAAVGAQLSAGAGDRAVGGMLDQVGLDQIRGLGGSWWLGQGGMDSVSTTYGYVDAEDPGLWEALRLPATPQTPPLWVRDNVSLYSQMNFSVERFAEAVKKVVDRTAGAGTYAKSIGAMRIGQSEMTVSELAQQLAGPVHIAAEIPENASDVTRQNVIVAIEVKDPQQMQSLIEQLATTAGAAESQVNGQKIFELAMDSVAEEFPGLPPLELAVTVSEGTLMLSPNKEYLKDTIQRAGTGRSLAESPEYQRVAEQFPDQTSVINYQKQDARFEGLYEQLRSGALPSAGLPGIAGQLLNFDFSKLPEFSQMSRYLQTTGSFIVPEPDGFRVVSFGLPPGEQ